jgi:hypothetical protein
MNENGQKRAKNNLDIVRGKGWNFVCLNAKKVKVEAILGNGITSEEHRYKNDNKYYVFYPNFGIVVGYLISVDKVKSVTFHARDALFAVSNIEGFIPCNLKTDQYIDFNSTIEKVLEIYGKPDQDVEYHAMRRLSYKGIRFKFFSGKMGSIYIS